MSVRRLGILGGTFDPIHFGHIDAGDAAQRALALDEVRLVPAHDPPHRPTDPRASAFHRFALAALAVQDRPSWRVSDAELRRAGESYTFDTLRALRAEGWRPWQILFILGADAFAEIGTWYRFPAVLEEAHFAVVARPGSSLAPALEQSPAIAARVRQPGTWPAADEATAIFPVHAVTRDVSSSLLRERLAAKQPIADLVPPAVARHIRAHGLYGAVDDLHGEEQHTHD